MIKTKVKTKFQGLVWVHEKYLEATKGGQSFVIEHDGKIMTISPAMVEEQKPKQSDTDFVEQYGKEKGKRYFLYGFKFVPDGVQTDPKKKAREQEALAQCPVCKAVKMTMQKGKVGWQQTFVVFDNLPKEKCYPCKAKDEKTEGATI